MELINPNAAGIDVGSRSHYVAINQNTDDVREFGVYAEDLKKLVEWLKEHQITSVAMESTGSYWQNLYTELIQADIEVLLTNGKFTKNIQNKKTDVLDCMWIQKLHSIGLLKSSFLPDFETEQLRTYCRHRLNLIQDAAKCSKRMSQNLRLMNLRLDVVVNDITGLTGLKIIQAICDGVTDGKKLAALRHGNCRKSEKEIEKALQCNGRKDYHYLLRQEYDHYCFIQNQIIQIDEKIKEHITSHIQEDETKKALYIEPKIHKRVNKNTPKNMDINLAAYQYFDGIDLMAIEGFSYGTVLTLMSELGEHGIKNFNTSKEFTSWLRLAPNNKISGGKVLSNRTPKGSNRLKIALRQAANAIGNLKDTHLSNFFNRVAFRKGRTSAVSATARKLAVIIWNMLTNHQQYNPPSTYEYLDQKRKKKVKQLQQQLAKLESQMNNMKTASALN